MGKNVIMTNSGVISERYISNVVDCSDDEIKRIAEFLERVQELLGEQLLSWEEVEDWRCELNDPKDIELHRESVDVLQRLHEAYKKYYPAKFNIAEGLNASFQMMPVEIRESELRFNAVDLFGDEDFNHLVVVSFSEPAIAAARNLELRLRY